MYQGRPTSELPSAPTATVDQLRETTRSNAIAHVINTSRINRFPVNCPACRMRNFFPINAPGMGRFQLLNLGVMG